MQPRPPHPPPTREVHQISRGLILSLFSSLCETANRRGFIQQGRQGRGAASALPAHCQHTASAEEKKKEFVSKVPFRQNCSSDKQSEWNESGRFLFCFVFLLDFSFLFWSLQSEFSAASFFFFFLMLEPEKQLQQRVDIKILGEAKSGRRATSFSNVLSNLL